MTGAANPVSMFFQESRIPGDQPGASLTRRTGCGNIAHRRRLLTDALSACQPLGGDCAMSFKGDLRQVSATDLLRYLHLCHRTGTLPLWTAGPHPPIAFHQSQLPSPTATPTNPLPTFF